MGTWPHGRFLRGYYADNGVRYTVYVPGYWGLAGLHRQWDDGDDFGKPTIPEGMIMRHVNLKDPTGTRRRNFPISRVEAGYWPFLGATCVLPNLDGSSTTWTVVSYNCESFQPLKVRIKRR